MAVNGLLGRRSRRGAAAQNNCEDNIELNDKVYLESVEDIDAVAGAFLGLPIVTQYTNEGFDITDELAYSKDGDIFRNIVVYDKDGAVKVCEFAAAQVYKGEVSMLFTDLAHAKAKASAVWVDKKRKLNFENFLKEEVYTYIVENRLGMFGNGKAEKEPASEERQEAAKQKLASAKARMRKAA